MKKQLLALVKRRQKKQSPVSPLLRELNDLQCAAVTSENRRVLVLAGAGSGKTKTLIQKVLYLIHEKGVDPGNILAITFTKNAANEMLDRLIFAADTTGEYRAIIEDKKTPWAKKEELRREYVSKTPWLSNVTVRTFHSLCYSILSKHIGASFDNKFRIISDDRVKEETYASGRTAPETQDEILHKIIKELSNDTAYLIALKQYIIEYYVDEKRRKYLSDNERYAKPYTTLDGTQVRSKSERHIADWLYLHRIKYVYEPLEQFKDFAFHPDFYIPTADLYIEHVSNLSQGMKDKEEQFSIANKTLFKTYEPMTRDIRAFHQAIERIILPRLHSKIETDTALRFEDEFKAYHDYLKNFIDMVGRVIDKIKVETNDFPAVFKRGKESPHDRVKKFYELSEPIIKRYHEYCTERSYLDFNDLILKTTALLEKHKEIAAALQDKYKHVLVDEFQDVNTSQVDLLKLLLTPKSQLFCVGDDWQSIYGFRGSEVEYIVNFKKHFPSATIIKLKTNYRSNDTIVEASNEVIKNNKFQLEKEVKALNKEGKNIYLYCAQREYEDGVKAVLEKIAQLLNAGYSGEDILILYRFTKAYTPYYEALRQQNIRVKNRTIHSAKGLEAKAVFIIGMTSGYNGFPNVRDDDSILQIVKKSNYERLMEEERRLFYVALTRAREELFLISEQGNESQFLKEIPGRFLDRNNFLILNIQRKMKQRCTACKKELDEEFAYCPYCGIAQTPPAIIPPAKPARPMTTMTPVELGETDDPAAIPLLKEFTRSPDYNNARLSASALGKLAHHKPAILEAVPSLIRLLDREEPQVRQYALKALAAIGDPRALPKAKDLAANDEKEYNRVEAENVVKKLSKIRT